MNYLEFIERLHGVLQPRTYLEIGVRNGDSLALSRCRSVGIDPMFEVVRELLAPTSLIRSTSDEYFAALGADGPFQDTPVDLAFIDGMHLLEFALRDFINVERRAAWSSVVVFDDVLPRDVDEAARERHTQAWTGDVFKIREVFESARPDLSLVVVDTDPTGLLLVLSLDPESLELGDAFDEIVGEHVAPDPQAVPLEVLRRVGAIAPSAALDLRVWDELRRHRDGAGLAGARRGLRRRASSAGGSDGRDLVRRWLEQDAN